MHPLLLVSGTPGCGKSTFARWLAQYRGFTHIDLDHDGLERHGFDGVWLKFQDHSEPEPLATAFAANGKPVVLDWGYPPILWPRIAQLISVGFSAWWFEADRLAARAHFIARGDVPVWAFDNQCAGIAAAWNEISPLYPGRIIRNLAPGGCFQEPEKVAAVVLGAV